MKNKKRHPSTNYNPVTITLPNHNPSTLFQLFSDVISLKLLQYLEDKMQPHYQVFNVIEVALFVDKYIDINLRRGQTQVEERELIVGSVPLPLEPKLRRNISENVGEEIPLELRKEETFEMLLEQLKLIFLYYAAPAISYEMINEYVYNQQLNCLSNGEVDEDYIEIGEKRVRIDENLKLCIMPLSEQGLQLKTTKIKDIAFRENKKGGELESIFAVTNQYIRGIRIKPELIGIASDFNRKGETNSCWYQYEPDLIKPKRATLSVIAKTEESVALSSAELKELKATNATNIEEKFSEQLLNILKASLSENLIGMISLDQSFVVEPIAGGKSRIMQGYIGNLLRDVPPEIVLSSSKEKYQEILLLHSYSDTEWLVLTNKFLYFYRIPLPSENIILKEQNNLHKASAYKLNPLLLMCQRLPKGCVKAITLNRPYLSLMLDNNSVIIIKMVINSWGVFEGSALNLDLNYYKITNKIYNDIQFKCMCFNPAFNNLFLTDFGAYLIRLTFNATYGDIEEEGITHDRLGSNALNQQMFSNSYSELKATKRRPQRGVIEQVEEEEGEEGAEYIQVFYLKPSRSQQSHLFSIYKKQNASPHTIIIKNQTRQVITFLTTNHNFNTLVSYESDSYEKKTGSEFEGEKYREWGNNNKIKLWDIRHMTIYKSFDVSLELSFLQLRANGLFALTADRGYLVLYPFNEDRKAMMGEAEQRILDINSREVTQELQQVFMQSNCLYFSTLTSSYNKYSNLKIHKTHIYQLQLQKYPQVKLLQSLPSEITALAVNSRLYVLENATQGVQASQLHIYNRLGLKEQMVIFSNPESVNAEGKINQENYSQQYKFLKHIDHQQFEAVIWNADSLKMIGTSPEESYTIVFSSAKLNHVGEGVERIRAIKDIQVLGPSMVVYCDNTMRIREKASIETISKVSESSERRSQPRQRVPKTHEQTESSIILISNQLDRVTFRLERISPRIKVLHMFNELLLTREEVGDSDCVRLLDVGQRGALLDKMLFSASFRRTTMERVRAPELREGEIESTPHNVLLQDLKEYFVRKQITLQDTKITVTSSNKMVLLLVFKVETHYSDLVTRKVLRSEVEFMVYGRNISDELLNSNYKISKIQVGKKTEKHLYEYQTSTTRTESIFGHKVLSIDDCFAISNYTEIDMHQLCEAIQADDGKRTIDITHKILAPKSINDNHIKDIYEVLSLKKDPLLYQRFHKHPNNIAVINAFSFKIVQFSDAQLNGTIAISNKLLRTIGVYSFQLDCVRRSAARLQVEAGEQPYELRMALEKIGMLQVKSQREIGAEEDERKAEPSTGKQEVQHVRMLEWSEKYKSSVEKMWEDTLGSIKQFISSERIKQTENKRSVSLPPIALQKLSVLQVKKKEMLKKLSASERQVPLLPHKHLESEGASLMFKKWTISQAIHMEKEGRDANATAEMKAVNRYVNRVLKSEEDTSERVQELIKNTRKIKQASQDISHSRNASPERMRMKTEADQTDRSTVTHLDNILRSSEIAKESNIRTYLQQKRTQKSPNEDTKQDYYRFSRNDTNKTELTIDIPPSRPENKSQNRANLSKLSNHTNLTKLTGKGTTTNIEASSNLELKIKQKLDELQDRSNINPKNTESLKFYTPERQLKHNHDSSFNINRLKTEKSRYNMTSPEEKQKIIRFTTEQTEPLNPKPHSQISLTLSPSQELQSPPPKRSANEKSLRFEDYKNNFSLLNFRQGQGIEVKGKEKEKESAVQRLKRSQQVMNSVYLPEIASTKEKLMKKMKERSYVRTIQAHLNDSTLLTIREGDRRKELIKKLYDYT